MGFRVQGLGSRVWGLGFGFKGSDSGIWVWDLESRVEGLGFRVQGLGSAFQGFRLGVWGSDSGFKEFGG